MWWMADTEMSLSCKLCIEHEEGSGLQYQQKCCCDGYDQDFGGKSNFLYGSIVPQEFTFTMLGGTVTFRDVMIRIPSFIS